MTNLAMRWLSIPTHLIVISTTMTFRTSKLRPVNETQSVDLLVTFNQNDEGNEYQLKYQKFILNSQVINGNKLSE